MRRLNMWPFGSHRAHAGLDPRPDWLAPLDELGVFHGHESYREAVVAAVARIEP
jgi:hypothetical protein